MPVSWSTTIRDPLNTIQESNNHRTVTLGIGLFPKKGKVFPLQARCGPEGG